MLLDVVLVHAANLKFIPVRHGFRAYQHENDPPTKIWPLVRIVSAVECKVAAFLSRYQHALDEYSLKSKDGLDEFSALAA